MKRHIHYILLWVEIPKETTGAAVRKWADLQERLTALATTTKGIVQLGEGAWLLPRYSGMIFAAECIARARSSSLTPHVRFLSGDEDDDPSTIPTSSPPEESS